MVERMQIGELARRAGVTHRTIHFYERMGLVQPSERTGQGYRYYGDTALKRLEKIKQLKNVGLSLEQIAEVLDLYFEDPSGIKGKERVIAMLKEQLSEIDDRITDMTRLRTEELERLSPATE